MADIPAVPGVPDIAPLPILGIGLALATGDAPGIASLFGAPAWGIYQDGSPVITADTVASMEYRQEWTISDYPVEQGAFESYDKVQTPFSARVSFAAGGSEAARMALLTSIAAIAGDLNFYDVATPTTVYPSVNIVHYDYRRTTQNGVGLLVVDVWLMEVRVVVGSGSGTATASPSGAGQQNGGVVQGGGIGSDAVAGGTAGAYPVTTPLPSSLGGGVGGLPVSGGSGGIGSA